jgi:hypothetical protein
MCHGLVAWLLKDTRWGVELSQGQPSPRPAPVLYPWSTPSSPSSCLEPHVEVKQASHLQFAEDQVNLGGGGGIVNTEDTDQVGEELRRNRSR